MIQIFTNDFLVHPCAVSIEFNHCSHNCVYCYAHTRGSGRKCEFNSVVNRLNRLRYEKPKVLLDWLLYYKYPICMSNWTDPFADNNYEQALALSHHLANIENGLFIQTKGGKGIDEFIENLGEKKNVVWYITITTPDDDKSAIAEPNAPRSSERIALVKKLKELGYTVIVGINPLMPSFTTFEDFKLLVDTLKGFGVHHFWISQLHLNAKEFASMNEARQNKIKEAFPFKNAENYIKTLKEYQETEEYNDFLDRVAMYLDEIEAYHTLYSGWAVYNDFMAEIHQALGGNTFFNYQDFINKVLEKDPDEQPLVFYDEYNEFMRAYNPELYVKELKGLPNNYILRSAFHSWKGNEEPQDVRDFEELLQGIWNYREFKYSPANNFVFEDIDIFSAKDGNRILVREGAFETPEDLLKYLEDNHISLLKEDA